MRMITSGCTQGAAGQEDTVGEQQTKRTDTIGAQFSDHTRLVLARDTITVQGCWCIRVGCCARLTQMWWRRWDLRGTFMSAAKRKLLCTALC